MRPVIVGLAGGTCSGKTSVANAVVERLGPAEVVVCAFDAFYPDLSHLTPVERSQRNYDEPDALDAEGFAEALDRLAAAEAADIPIYDFATHTRRPEVVVLEPRPVVVAEGILLLCSPAVRSRLHRSVFLDASLTRQLSRRIERDVRDRARDPGDIRRQFVETVRPSYRRHVLPSRDHADLVIGDVSIEAATDEVCELIAALRQPVS